ncbi:MAG: ornithine cyclodeaminase family protein, partial [Lachnospiraceae bacterium]|nr:ornithine cyclodeaminase family protein [Lachnospiraceae bacterium]
MIVLSRKEIEEFMNLNEMMDQIEEAYRIFGTGEYYMPPRPSVEHENKTLMYMPCYT